MFGKLADWNLARRKLRAVLGRVNLIYCNRYQCWSAVQFKHGGRVDPFRISDIIDLIGINTCQSGFTYFRLDWFYNVVVHYCGNISPPAKLNWPAFKNLLNDSRQSEDDGFSQNFSFPIFFFVIKTWLL